MAAATYDFTIEAGAAEPLRVTWRAPGTTPSVKGAPIDLTGWSAQFELRERAGAQQAVLTLTSAPGEGITLGGVAGTVRCDFADSVTDALTIRHGVYRLDLISPSGKTTRLLKGTVLISR